MSRRRRGAALLGLALALGGLAATDIGRREAAMREQLAPLIETVVARAELPVGRRLRARDLAVRRIPAHYAPVGAGVPATEFVGRRLVARVPGGGYVSPDLLREEVIAGPAAVRRGERAVEVTGAAAPALVVPGVFVDVLAVPERGAAQLALQDAEVLAAGTGAPAGEAAAPRVTATLRVSARQALYLASLEGRGGELRLLPRAPGDHGRAPAG